MPNPLYYDRRKQTSTSTGTGNFTLNAATGPWKQLNTTGAALQTTYCIAHQTAGDWETGVGSIDSGSATLTRSYVLDGSVGTGSFTNFSGGNKDVFLTAISAYLPRVRPSLCEGRLGLVSGQPGADSTSGSTLYFTPLAGGQIAIPEPQTQGAGQWRIFDFTELSLSLSGLTAGLPYDVFVVDNAGLQLNYAQWQTATTRQTAINYVDGIPMVSVVTNGWRYLGTIYPTSATTTADAPKQRFVWNFYNQLPRRIANFPQTGSWNVTGPLAWRGQNGDVTKVRAVEFVYGLTPPVRVVNVRASCILSCAVNTFGSLGLTLDGTGAPSFTDSYIPQFGGTASAIEGMITAEYNQFPGIGYHYLQPVEYITGSNVITFYDFYTNQLAGGVTGTIWG